MINYIILSFLLGIAIGFIFYANALNGLRERANKALDILYKVDVCEDWGAPESRCQNGWLIDEAMSYLEIATGREAWNMPIKRITQAVEWAQKHFNSGGKKNG